MQSNSSPLFNQTQRHSTMTRVLHSWLARDTLWLAALLAILVAFVALASQPPRSIAMPVAGSGAQWMLRGVHPVEQPDARQPAFRWTKGRAVLTVPNPGGALLFQLRLAGGPGRTVPLSVQVGATTTPLSVAPAFRIYRVLLPPQPGERLTVRLLSSTWQDAASDRALGVVLGDMRLSGRGMLRGSMLLPLLLASAWAYMGMRLLRWRVRTSFALAALAGAWLAVWQITGGWQAARFEALLLTCALLVAAWVAARFAAAHVAWRWPAVASLAWLPRLALSAPRAFVIAGLTAGALLLCLTPPFQVPDEPAHFYRAYQITDGGLLPVRQGSAAGGYVPSEVARTAHVLAVYLISNREHKQNINTILAYLTAPPHQSDVQFIIFSNTAIYSPVAYAPQVLGIGIGRLLGLSPLALMYCGRAASVLCYVLLVGIALRITPVLKWVFFLLALTPMALFQMASLSADGMTNGLAFLFIAGVLHCAFGAQPLTRWAIARLAAAAVLLALAKYSFVLIVPLCLIIPVQRFGTMRRYAAACASIIGVSVLAAVAWYLAVRDVRINYVPGSDQDAQFQFALAHPLWVVGVVLIDYVQHGWDYLTQFTGVLGWLDAPVPVPFLVSYWIMLYLAARVGMQQPLPLTRASRMLVAALLFGNMVVLSALLFITWVPVGELFIQALQGRHFIPLSPLFFLLVYRYNQRLKLDQQRWGFVVLCYTVVTVGVTAATLIGRYYIA